LKLVDLIDALDHFLVAPLVALNVQIMPNYQLSVQIGMEDLLLQRLSHVQQLGNQSKFIGILVFVDHREYFGCFIFDGLPQNCPILIVMFLGSLGLLDVESHDLLGNSNKVLDVFLESIDKHREVVPPDFAPSVVGRFAVIYIL